jgi:hypothetical protein
VPSGLLRLDGRTSETPGSDKASKGGRKSPERMVSGGAHVCLGGVRLEALGQLLRTAQRRRVSAADLVGGDPQALSSHAADEGSASISDERLSEAGDSAKPGHHVTDVLGCRT